jgi:hypothetical protein
MSKRIGLLVAVLLAAVVAAVPYLWGIGVFKSSNSAADPSTSWVSGTPTATVSNVPTPSVTAVVPPPASAVAPTPLLHPAPVTISASGFWSYALMDRTTGQITQTSANAATTNVTASMIKAWLAADYLRRNATVSSYNQHELSIMIRDSDNNAASYFWKLDGTFASITRLNSMCGLTDTKGHLDWANTLLSARDAVRMGQCIGAGVAAGPKWTSWLLNEMRNVRGVGRFGIITALPAAVAAQTSIKNGWVVKSDGDWHVNCMAIGTDWVLGVMTVYPASKGEGQGIGICQSIATQLMA